MQEFEEAEEGAAAPTGDAEFPVAFSRFAPTLVGTANEVWTKWLGLQHGNEKHTPTDWLKLIDLHRGQPAYKQ